MSRENLFTPGCIRTFTGVYVNPTQPDSMEIRIEDIAHALSHQPRFGGHLPVFYSVAQHCVAVANMLPQELKLTGLMHDSSEAYLIDVPRPVKQQLANYKEIENSLMLRISSVFGFTWPMPELVIQADEKALHWEWEYIMLKGRCSPPPMPLAPPNAEIEFLELFKSLT